MDTNIQCVVEIKLEFDPNGENIDPITISRESLSSEVASVEFHIMLTLSNITIHTFIKSQDNTFFIEFIVYHNSDLFVRCDDNAICCMTIEIEMLINSIDCINFIRMPCVQNKIFSNAEKIILEKFIYFCSKFASVINDTDDINEIVEDNDKIIETFNDVFFVAFLNT